MRLLFPFLKRALLVCTAGVLAGATQMPPERMILQLEQARSLGNGRLALVLSSSDEVTAVRAALAIGRTKQADGRRLLEAHLADPRDAVRALSVYGLGVIGLGSDARLLARLATEDRSGAVRLAALDALGRYEEAARFSKRDEKTSVDAALKALASDVNPLVRGRAAIALNFFADGAQGGRCARALAEALVSESSPHVRERLAWTIFRRYAKRVPRPLLSRLLRDRDEIVRIEAVRAYGKLKGPAAIAQLTPLLGDPSWRVQEQTAESIRLLQGKPLTAHLTSIPPFVHLPPIGSDPLAALPALPRSRLSGKASPPTASDAMHDPSVDPKTAAQMLGPAHGPHPRLRIVTTKGNIYVVLYPEWAPLTVANFLKLTERGFYDRNPWFRIVPDFVVQTGEKDAKKAPGPGYTIGAEENPLEQNAYVISMGLDYNNKTNTPIRDSAGSEYYITLSPQYHLDNAFTVFGVVTNGFDVLAHLDESDEVVRIERVPDATL
jgi:peptidyl-prolyl cis-trans isomerase B (cyclophilin B)